MAGSDPANVAVTLSAVNDALLPTQSVICTQASGVAGVGALPHTHSRTAVHLHSRKNALPMTVTGNVTCRAMRSPDLGEETAR